MDAKSKAEFINSVSAEQENARPEPAAPVSPVKYVESEAIFAKGLPAWDIEPPTMLVRRH